MVGIVLTYCTAMAYFAAMRQKLLFFALLIGSLVFTACNPWTDDKIKEGITRFYEQGNGQAGGGNTTVEEIKLLSQTSTDDSCMVQAVVKGRYRNSAMPTPIDEALHDTLEFILVLPAEPLVARVRRLNQ